MSIVTTPTLSSYASPTMASPGIGSGLNVNSIVSQLVALEQQPLLALQTQATTINAKISTYGLLKSSMSSLSSAASALANATGWNAVTATSSNSSAVSVSATAGTAALNVSVAVQNLALAQSSATQDIAANSTPGSGTLQIQLGTWSSSGSSFSPSSASPVSISVSATDTLSTIASKINSAGAGVTATVLTDANGQRLLLQSKSTGAAAGFQVTAQDDDGNNTDNAGLSQLVYGLSNTQYGQNANATVNGIAVSSATNTLSNAIPGLTLNLLQVTGAPVAVTVAQNTNTITQEINAFVAAYNGINDALNSDTAYNAATSTAGPLQGDTVANQMQYALRGVLDGTTSGGAYTQLSDIGITVQQGGDLQVDASKLATALQQNPSAVQNLFTAGTGTGATDGMAQKMLSFATQALSVSGIFSAQNNALQSKLTSNSNEQTAVNNHAAQVKQQLTAQYTALDGKMASLNALSAYVTQQVTLWNKSTTSG